MIHSAAYYQASERTLDVAADQDWFSIDVPDAGWVYISYHFQNLGVQM